MIFSMLIVEQQRLPGSEWLVWNGDHNVCVHGSSAIHRMSGWRIEIIGWSGHMCRRNAAEDYEHRNLQPEDSNKRHKLLKVENRTREFKHEYP